MRGSPGSVAGMVEAEFRVWVLAHVAGSREPGTTFGDRGGRSGRRNGGLAASVQRTHWGTRSFGNERFV